MNWQTWLVNGEKYLRSASGKNGNPSKFIGAIRYNLVSLALESFVMAILDYHGKLPENHTFTDLVDALQLVVPLDPLLRKRILAQEDVQSICSLEAYHRHEPQADDIDDLQDAVSQISIVAHEVCVNTSPEGVLVQEVMP